MKRLLLDLAAASVVVVLLIYLNYSLIRYWFVGDFNQNMGSIEISYIQMAKFWLEDGTLWRPQWYLGHPWHTFYTPLLPALEVVLNKLAGFSVAHAYRVITGVAFVMVPVTAFFFVWQIGKSKTGALVASLLYTFAPSIIAVIFKEVAEDTLSGGFEPRRFAIMVRWGEGPHTLALVFLPLFGVFVAKYFEKKRFRDLLLAACFFALIALTNALVVWAAILLLFTYLLAQILKNTREITWQIRSSFGILFWTFLLVAFWYNLPFLATFFREGSGALGNWLALFPWGVIAIVAVSALVITIVGKFLNFVPGLPFAIFWFLVTFAVVFVYYASGDLRLEYVPQALRFNTEVDLAAAILVGVIISKAYLSLSSLAPGVYLGRIVATLLFCTLAAAILLGSRRYFSILPEFTRDLSYRRIGSPEGYSEYRVSKKLEELTAGSGQRVLAPGNYGFWLNYFVPVAQLRGGLFQASTHSWPEHIYYQVTRGVDSQITLALLKIANIGKVVYTTGGTDEIFRDFKVPQEKFDKIARSVYEDKGDIYFDIPLKNDSLAKIVKKEEILKVDKPKNAIDSKPIFAYVEALERASDRKVMVEKLADYHFRLSGDINKGEAILFQETYDSGWSVSSSTGAGWKKHKDSFDFVILEPESYGSFSIDLVYKRPWSVWAGYLVTLAAVGWLVSKFIFKKRKVY